MLLELIIPTLNKHFNILNTNMNIYIVQYVTKFYKALKGSSTPIVFGLMVPVINEHSNIFSNICTL